MRICTENAQPLGSPRAAAWGELARHLDVIEISENYSLVEEQAPAAWYNKSIMELSVRARLGINIIAVKNGSDINIAPGGDYIVRESDVLVIIGRDDALAKLRKN